MRPLITRIHTPADSVVFESDRHHIEPAFQVAYHPRLKVDSRGWQDKARAHYTHAVARHPLELWLHVQRILHLITLRDERLFCAFQDLFQVLHGRGERLCRGLIGRAADQLTRTEHAILARCQEQDPEGDPDPPGRRLIERLLIEESADDPLESARQYLAYGQLTLARETLEQALDDAPLREPLHEALLEIYRHTRDIDRVETWHQRLMPLPMQLETIWQDLIAFLRKEPTPR
ncbi:MAG: hypothetical protein ABW076_06445 [Candidatus Thiodiazotropha sp.]